MRSFYLLLLFNVLVIKGQSQVEVPVRVPVVVLKGSDADTCPTEQDTFDAQDELRQNISAILPLTYSCGETGWRRVGYLDMTDPSQSCPPGLGLKAYSPELRSCGRANNTAFTCWSTFYSTGDSQYSRVCGRIRGYQFGFTSAFLGYIRQRVGLDRYFVDGVSLTHGQSGSRTHIWTFASGLTEVHDNNYGSTVCPCAAPGLLEIPPYIGNDYFCESAVHTAWRPGQSFIFYPDDPLWDGQNCASSTCCRFNSPPYFTKALPAVTSDDIELRICSYRDGSDTPIDQLELYVQ